MKIAVLSFKKNLQNYENKMLRNAALKEGVNLVFIDPNDVIIDIVDNNIKLFYENKEITNIDYLLVRIGCMITKHISHVIDAFEFNKTKVSISSEEINNFADKFKTHLILSNNNINNINTKKINEFNEFNKLNYPLVLKSNTGSIGWGTYLINNEQELINMYNQTKLLDNSFEFFIQDYIDFEFGSDYRVFVIDKKIHRVMNRKSDGKDFRANFSIHNNATNYNIEEDIIEITKKITKVFNADILGIDLLKTKNGYIVCEINSSPGFKGMDSISTNNDTAREIIKSIKSQFRKG